MIAQISIKEDQIDALREEYIKLEDADALEMMSRSIDPSDRSRVVYLIGFDRLEKIKHCIPGFRLLGLYEGERG